MKRPRLRYAYNEALINTYAKELEKYCDELEKAITESCKCDYTEQDFEACNANEWKEKCKKGELQ